MERHLAERAFLVGERYTVADIALYGYTNVAEEGGFELGRFPAVGGVAGTGGGPARAHPDRRVTRQAVRRRRVAAPSASESAVAPIRITASRHTAAVTVDEAATRDSASYA